MERLDDNTAKGILDSYIGALTTFGYVKERTVSGIVMYVFLKDFSERMQDFLTDRDKKLIDKAVSCLFSSGNCLIPYKIK